MNMKSVSACDFLAQVKLAPRVHGPPSMVRQAQHRKCIAQWVLISTKCHSTWCAFTYHKNTKVGKMVAMTDDNVSINSSKSTSISSPVTTTI